MTLPQGVTEISHSQEEGGQMDRQAENIMPQPPVWGDRKVMWFILSTVDQICEPKYSESSLLCKLNVTPSFVLYQWVGSTVSVFFIYSERFTQARLSCHQLSGEGVGGWRANHAGQSLWQFRLRGPDSPLFPPNKSESLLIKVGPGRKRTSNGSRPANIIKAPSHMQHNRAPSLGHTI